MRRTTPDYLLEQWEKPDGTYVIAKAPAGGHYRATLASYIPHQYYHQHVTEPLLLEQLKELGFKISAGKLSDLIIRRLTHQLEISRCHHNFLRPHGGLRFGQEIRTPAMVAGPSERVLSFRDIYAPAPTNS